MMRTRKGSRDRLVIASRSSRLALTQTNLVVDALRVHHPGLEVDVVEITTTGDRDHRPFSAIGGKGLFTSEVERAVVDGRAHLAVHSAKDLTADLAGGCEILCVPRRAGRDDVVVGGTGATGDERIRSLPPGASVGTSSMRRRALLVETRRDLEAVEFRGNLETRLRKVRSGSVHAAIVAAAGLERLHIDSGYAPLEPEWWVPAPGQGALAVEGMADDDESRELLAPLSDPTTSAELTCERAFAQRLEGGCSVPLGCSAVSGGDRIVATGYLGSLDGRSLREHLSGPASDAHEIGIELAEAILVAGGDAILAAISGREAPVVEEP